MLIIIVGGGGDRKGRVIVITDKNRKTFQSSFFSDTAQVSVPGEQLL